MYMCGYIQAGWLLGPGSPGTSRVLMLTFLVFNIFYFLVMCFGVCTCKSGYGIRMGWFG